MPRKMFHILFSLFSLVFLVACGAQPTAAPTPTEASPAPTSTGVPAPELAPPVGFSPTFEPEPCSFELPPAMIEGDDVDCGFVVVPADHQDPSAGTLRLAVVVVRDQSENHQPDPVILLSGGPGEKTVANALPISQIFAPYFPSRDFILFDQRGVGLSEPALECPEWGEALFGLMDETDPEVFMKASYDGLMVCRDRLVAEGHDLSVYNTVQNAADVDAIRQALGYEHLNLLGGSYGSILAQEAARQHPDTTRSVILAATWPLEQSFFIGVSETSGAALLSMLEACEQDESCNEAYPHLQDVLFELIERLDAEPVDITITDPLDGERYDAVLAGRDLINNLTLFLYLTDLIPTLPEAIYAVYNGDYDLMTRLQSISLLLYGATTRGMLYSVVCAEDLIGQTPEDLLAAREQLPPQFLGDLDPEDIIQYGIFGICENWPVEQVDPSFKQAWESDIPTLLLEGEFDPVTPIEYANMVAAHLDNSYVFEFPGIGHDVLASSRCALSIAGDFIDDPSQAPNAACVAEMPEMAFDLPREEQGELTLKPFTHEGYGLQALGPEGWESPRTGVFVRGESAIDQTALIYDMPAMNQEDFVQLLKAQLSLPESPEPVDEIESNGFEWTLYHEEVRGVAVDVAITPFGEEGTLAVILQSDVGEQEALYEIVFLPAVRAVAPLDAAAADFSFASPASQDAELVESGTDADSDSIVVPAGTPPTIDGTLSPGEWDETLVEILSDGSELLLMRSGDYLYLSVRSNTPEMIGANIYLEDNGQIMILHTSAALGTAIYQQGADGWQQTQRFDWQCRDSSNSVSAQAERSAYLDENHWLAANSRMGAPNELEYQIEVMDASQRLAVSVFRSSTPDERAFWPLTLDDDCIKPNPGGLLPELHFSPDQWGMLNLKNLGDVEKT